MGIDIVKNTVAAVIADAVEASLDGQELESVSAGETLSAACTSCIDSMVMWLKDDGPTRCTGEQSCNGADFIAGGVLHWAGVSSMCSAQLGGDDGATSASAAVALL